MTTRSLILKTASRYLLPMLLIFSVYLLLRGHNEPGGGFVGGLVSAAGFALYGFASGMPEARRALLAEPHDLIAGGLLITITSGLLAFFRNSPLLTGLWADVEIPVIGKLGTPLLFDVGVYLLVVGVTLMIIFSLDEEA